MYVVSDRFDAVECIAWAAERGILFVAPGDAVYGGMLVGENPRVGDLPEAGTTVPKEFELGGRTAGRVFTPAERVAEVSGWARQRLESWQSRWDKEATDARQRWEDGERLLKLARRFAALAFITEYL